MSYALQRVKDVDTDTTLVNSQADGQTALNSPGPFQSSSVSLEILALGSRRTVVGRHCHSGHGRRPVRPPHRAFELVGSVRNISRDYSDPASVRSQDDIPQKEDLPNGLRGSCRRPIPRVVQRRSTLTEQASYTSPCASLASVDYPAASFHTKKIDFVDRACRSAGRRNNRRVPHEACITSVSKSGLSARLAPAP